MPLFRRIPKRGFNNKWRVEFEVVNLSQLNCFGDGEEVTPTRLAEAGLIKEAGAKVKILGKGALKRSLTITAHKFSKSAAQKIQDAGGAPLQIEK